MQAVRSPARLTRPVRLLRRALRWPRRWWGRQSLRARLTLVATALFAFAVATGAVLLIFLQRTALTRVLDQSALKNAHDIAKQFRDGQVPRPVQPTASGIAGVQVVDRNDTVLSASAGTDQTVPVLDPVQLRAVRAGARIEIVSPSSGASLRALGQPVGDLTVVVLTDVSRVEDSLRILTRAALIGGPLAVLLLAVATYFTVALTLRSVAALRYGAAAITAAGLAEQRLPVPRAQDEIHRLAVTLNAMLDRIDTATARQRTFVGDAAHELRSPLASLRVQLEVAQRIGPEPELVDDLLTDVERLDRLVEDLLALARLDETEEHSTLRPLAWDELVQTIVRGYRYARVPVGEHVQPALVAGDADALRRVVINLVDNAVRHASSQVSVTVERTERGDRPVALLTVVDDGAGIPEHERQRVFDRFYRVQESRSRDSGGTGLGLPIVRDIVRAHGGRVRFTDRRDGRPGARAVVVLPLLADGTDPVDVT